MAFSLTALSTTLSTRMSPSSRSRAAASRRWASGSPVELRRCASAASSFWSITSSSVRRNRSDAASSGSPSPIRPWATAWRLTSEAQTVSPIRPGRGHVAGLGRRVRRSLLVAGGEREHGQARRAARRQAGLAC